MQLPKAISLQLMSVREWSQSTGGSREISLFDYPALVGTPDLFFGFAELFCPTLVEHHGGCFLAAKFSEPTFDLWEQKGVGIVEIQRVMNHVHVSTLLQNQSVSDELAVQVAQHLATIWSLTLQPLGVSAEAFGERLDDAAATLYRSVP